MQVSQAASIANRLQLRWQAAISAASADALGRLDSERLGAEGVHRIRVQIKHLRAYCELCLPQVDPQQLDEPLRGLRWTAKQLARSRDVAALRAAAAQLLAEQAAAEDRAAFEALWLGLRGESIEHVDASTRARMRRSLENAQATLLDITGSYDLFELVQRGLARSRSRCLASHTRAIRDPSAGRLHSWRKRLKTFSLQLDGTRTRAWRRTSLRRRTRDLSQLLGELHDLAGLRQRVAGLDEHAGSVARTRAALLLDERIAQQTQEALLQGGRCRQALLQLELIESASSRSDVR